MVQTRRKDDYSSSRGGNRRRSRYVDDDDDDDDVWEYHQRTSARKSFRFRENPQRTGRRVGRVVYVEQQSEEDDYQTDSPIFRVPTRRSRLTRTSSHNLRSDSTDLPNTSNGHGEVSMEEEEEDTVIQENDGVVRRSTRQRKLTHEILTDSWIVGTQTTLRGYPSYKQNESIASEKGKSSQERRSSTSHKREPAQRAQSSKVRSPIKEENEEEEDEEEEEENDEENEAAGDGDQKQQEGSEKSKADAEEEENDDEANEVEKEDENESLADDDAKQNGIRSSKRIRNVRAAVEKVDDNYTDMYSRVKRTRRPTKRYLNSSYETTNFRKRTRNVGSSTDSSSSENSDSESDGSNKQEKPVRTRKYQLRLVKPTVDRFQAEPVRRPQRGFRKLLCNSSVIRLDRRGKSRFAGASSSSSSDSEPHLNRINRSRCVGMPHHSIRSKDIKTPTTLADVDPMTLDTSIRFEHVGGLEDHIRCLQEMVVFPMLYKEVFQKFHISPPKGVLFHGPPGTGKTLIARALANECSQGSQKVSFFMRKGADCLSKWVGESERQLRLLFDQALQMKPSIIFFDEIDGLAPVRSSKQDQIHASIVSTLLALMDGLDNRGDVIVIGATNRIDAIDPALRRPGRFDRELYFPLPAMKERQEILRIHMNNWEKKPEPKLLDELAEQAAGYCGSDLRALCSESVIQALRRTYPQIYKSSQRLLLDPNKVEIVSADFARARSCIIPAAHRVAPSPARKLPAFLEPLFKANLDKVVDQIREIFPHGLTRDKSIDAVIHRPRLLLCGSCEEQGQTTHLAPALLHFMEHIPVHTLDLATLYEISARSPEETVTQVFQEARRNPPSIIYLPGLGQWWTLVPNTVQAVFLMQLRKLDMSAPVLLLATSDERYKNLCIEVCELFSQYRDEVYAMSNPKPQEREAFFGPLLLKRAFQEPEVKVAEEDLEELPLAPPPEPPKLTEEQLKILYEKEEHTLRELRIFLREVCAKLARNRQFFMFTKPVDLNEVPDYQEIIKQPMDLETMMTRIDQHQYVCAKEFLEDIELICSNALEYNPDKNPDDKLIRHRACFLRDTANALIKAEMDSDFEQKCRGISRDRKLRKDSPSRYAPAPDFIHTQPLSTPTVVKTQEVKEAKTAERQGRALNGDISSHSSSVSNNFGLNGSALDSSSRKKRRRKQQWNRGRTPKRKKRLENNFTLSLDQSKDSKPRSSTPSKKVEENLSLSTVNGDIAHESSSDEGEAPPSPLDVTEQGSGVENTIGEEEQTINEFNETSVIGGGDLKKSPTPTPGTPDKIIIDKGSLKKLLEEIVLETEKCAADVLIELYVRLDKCQHRYLHTLNRSELPQELQKEFDNFKAHLSLRNNEH